MPTSLANGEIAVRMDVWQGAVDQRAVHVVAALVRRALVGAATDHAAEIHLLQVHVHPGTPKLLGTPRDGAQGQGALTALLEQLHGGAKAGGAQVPVVIGGVGGGGHGASRVLTR